MKKELAVGGENFPNMIRNHNYYVDKTGFIRMVMESESRVLLVTRPRRFGKTLFIDTLKSFLQIDFVNPGAATKNAALFSGLAVMQQRDFCAVFMGQYPVNFDFSQGAPVVLIETDRRYFDIYVDETQAGVYRPGTQVKADVPPLGKSVTGTVRFTLAAPSFADLRNTRERGQADLTSFQVRIYVAADEELLTGMTLEVTK